MYFFSLALHILAVPIFSKYIPLTMLNNNFIYKILNKQVEFLKSHSPPTSFRYNLLQVKLTHFKCEDRVSFGNCIHPCNNYHNQPKIFLHVTILSPTHGHKIPLIYAVTSFHVDGIKHHVVYL